MMSEFFIFFFFRMHVFLPQGGYDLVYVYYMTLPVQDAQAI